MKEATAKQAKAKPHHRSYDIHDSNIKKFTFT